ncbi:MAG: twin-arginine translocase subunit TatC [Bacteroidota bacterium]|nr:twin-arginine translocase subunit TatC [Candidatus Kapabacteria bacterium]MCS7303157.1 twin-arginine translocase subunit TatC [Candidatus Kapabacteria bacterium]MCX7937369.1 twin-arginine translocase subunit TatC [Chlorobiota bacterium]MDW8075854.1 twin-arginine translocase subunit TatC [Bacteroidota bacterium]MDW8271826.1 twin-arginine translocase subunit TatC [Bacteroidota bacterium]
METPNDHEMGFLDHLEELRRRIISSVIGFLLASIGVGFFIGDIVDHVLLRPAIEAGLRLQNLRPFGQAFLYFKLIFICGFIVSFPWILWNLWRFVAPGLYEHERRWARQITAWTSVCFLAGVAFAYFAMIPSMMAFAKSFGSAQIENIIDVNEYLGFFATVILAAGLIFELPMILYVLSRAGIVTPTMLATYRRHAIVVILIIAAVLTPTPDPINQLFFAAPLYVLYELGIVISKFAARKRIAPTADQ